MTNGGEGANGRLVSLKQKQKMSKKMKGNKNGTGNKARTGYKRTEEEKEYLSTINTGIRHPQYGQQRSEETKRKIKENSPTAKIVKTPLGIFLSQGDAATAHDCSKSSIGRRCRSSNFPDFKCK